MENQIQYVKDTLQKGVEYLSSAKNTLKNSAVLGLTSLVLATYAGGCGTINGIASDTEQFSGAVRKWTQSYVDKQSDSRLYNADLERQQRLDKAANLVLERNGQ